MKIIMKKSILLNEDEKNRILNLHETAKNLYENKKPVSSIKETNTKKEDMKKVIKLTESDLERIVRRVIEEQYMGVAFGGEQNGLRIKKVEATEQVMAAGGEDPKVKYKNLVAKVDQFLPFDIKQLQDAAAKIKSGQGVLVDVAQPFLKVQNLLQKINSEGYQMATTSGWKNYKSNITGQSIQGMDSKNVYLAAINDLIGIKGALRNKAAEMAGLAATFPQWAKTEMGKKIIDHYSNAAGLTQA